MTYQTTEERRHLPSWRKARRSIGNGDCVEVTHAGGKILVRDSKSPDRAIVGYQADVWRSFISSAKQGGFDMHSLFSSSRGKGPSRKQSKCTS